MKRVSFFVVFAVLAANVLFAQTGPNTTAVPDAGRSELIVKHGGTHTLPVLLFVDGEHKGTLYWDSANAENRDHLLVNIPNGRHKIELAVDLNRDNLPSGSSFQGWRGEDINFYNESVTLTFTTSPYVAGVRVLGDLERRPLGIYGQYGIYIGIVSFADDAKIITNERLIHLDDDHIDILKDALKFDYEIADKNHPGTSLYYAVHKALAHLTVEAPIIKDTLPMDENAVGLDAVNLFTFTDGIENNSTSFTLTPIENQDFRPTTQKPANAYRTYIEGNQGLLRSVPGVNAGNEKIVAYTVGVRGLDVSPRDTTFSSSLSGLASPGKVSESVPGREVFKPSRSAIVYLVLDSSYSLSGKNSTGLTDGETVRNAAIQFIETLNDVQNQENAKFAEEQAKAAAGF
ncbi:hypothetical protein FACS1894172_20550 [Spirochaetia bacterium]|nr:hypothetical protein FACS1894172_20550 [Spirochaetia bacterium]